MKRIYDFSRKPAKRNYTISDLQALKQKSKKLTMSNSANADEIRARQYNERFNGTLRKEALNAEWVHTTRQAQIAINVWLRQ